MPLAEHDLDGRAGGYDAAFQFTCPSRSTTTEPSRRCPTCQVSIHVPLAEHDNPRLPEATAGCRFNSRAPRGARPDSGRCSAPSLQFQFTCPSRSTTVIVYQLFAQAEFQFTCPSRSTTRRCKIRRRNSLSFNSRAPRGARHPQAEPCSHHARFQFTCPSRSTTS